MANNQPNQRCLGNLVPTSLGRQDLSPWIGVACIMSAGESLDFNKQQGLQMCAMRYKILIIALLFTARAFAHDAPLG